MTLWSRVANSRPLAWLVFLILYAVPTVLLARQKMLWDDEFFTLYLSRIQSWSELIRALSTGADQHPPSFYYAVHLGFALFGTSNLTLRLLPIVGFGVMCLCL